MIQQQGMLSVPLLHRQTSEKEHFALLNGTKNNLCLDGKSSELSEWYRKMAWSSGNNIYIAFNNGMCYIFRFDRPQIESYDEKLVFDNTDSFFNYLGKGTSNVENSIVPYVLRTYRQIRNEIRTGNSGLDSLKALLYLLAFSRDGENMNLDAWGMTTEDVGICQIIDRNKWDMITERFMNGVLFTDKWLKPDIDLILRHTAGKLFEEANYIAYLPPQLNLFPDEKIKYSYDTMQDGAYFTPAYVARSVVEESLLKVDLAGKDRLTIFDPACGASGFLVEALRQLKKAGFDNAFTFTSTENGWTIMQSDGKYLYQSGDYNNFNVNAAPTSGQYFDVEALEGGTFKITNKEKSKFIQYVPANTNIGCFAEAQEGAILPMLYAEEAAVTKYTITITPAEHGSMTLDKYEAAEGEKVYVTEMKVDDGWEMNQPTITAENGEEVEIGGSDEEGHYLVMPASNVTITLSITQLYTITPVFDSNKGDVRGISFDSEKSPIYKGAGKNVKFTVTAKEGFEVESVTAACEDNTPITVNVAADNSYYEFQMPAKNVTITATFSPVSGISNITAAKAENAVRYNLAGQKVNAGYKGVVIMNGKKMLQK